MSSVSWIKIMKTLICTLWCVYACNLYVSLFKTLISLLWTRFYISPFSSFALNNYYNPLKTDSIALNNLLLHIKFVPIKNTSCKLYYIAVISNHLYLNLTARTPHNDIVTHLPASLHTWFIIHRIIFVPSITLNRNFRTAPSGVNFLRFATQFQAKSL